MKNKFDSKEELHFSWWLDQLKAAKYIKHWECNDYSFPLFGGLVHSYIKPMKRVEDKIMTQTILKPSVYTPDFIIYWEPKAIGIFASMMHSTEGKIETLFLCDKDLKSTVETKGNFDRNNMTRLAINNIKFVYEKYQIYIDLIKLPGLFNQTFTPDRYFMTDKTFKPRTLNYKNVRTLREFIKSLHE